MDVRGKRVGEQREAVERLIGVLGPGLRERGTAGGGQTGGEGAKWHGPS